MKQKKRKIKIYPIFCGLVKFKILTNKGKTKDIGFEEQVYKNTNESQQFVVEKLENKYCNKNEKVEVISISKEKQIGISLVKN